MPAPNDPTMRDRNRRNTPWLEGEGGDHGQGGSADLVGSEAILDSDYAPV
jgi:hypothetical protein